MLRASAWAEDFPRWGEAKDYLTWFGPPGYKTSLDDIYPWSRELPTLDRFPELLKWRRKLGLEADGFIDSQMCALSRCRFYPPLTTGRARTRKQDSDTALEKYEDWWNYYGRDLAENLVAKAKTYPQVWARLPAGKAGEPCPLYPLLLPEEWSCSITLRGGDYFALFEEVIELSVSKERCELTRRYCNVGSLRGLWHLEVWDHLTHDEAQDFLAALHYAADAPWMFRDDEVYENKHVRGRPDTWSSYYAFPQWSGILDAKKRVIFDADPSHWDWSPTQREIEMRKSFMENKSGRATSDSIGSLFLKDGVGTMFRVIRDFFPDPSFDAQSSRWVEVGWMTNNSRGRWAETTPENRRKSK